MRRFLQSIRYNRAIAGALFILGRPLARAGGAIERRIESAVKRNGGTAFYDGITLTFPPGVGPDFLSLISWHGAEGYEPETWRALRPLVERGGTFLDVGANIGLFSVLAKKAQPALEVIAFEPVPEILWQCTDFHAANGLAAEVHCLALSDADERTVLYWPQHDGELSSAATLSSDSWQARKRPRELIVESTRLDSLLQGRILGRPLTLKIDVEDCEAAVLRGAQRTIAEYRPLIVCEILPRHRRAGTDMGAAEQHENAATVAALAAIGYEAFAIARDGLFRFAPADFAVPRALADFLLVPEELVGGRCYLASAADLVGTRTLNSVPDSAARSVAG